MIETQLNELIESGKRTNALLEAILANGGATAAKTKATKDKAQEPAAAKTAEPTPAPAPEPAAEPDLLDDTPAPRTLTKDDIRGALVAYQTAKGKPVTLELLKKYGATSIGTLSAENQPKLYAEVEAALGENAAKLIADAIAASKK